MNLTLPMWPIYMTDVVGCSLSVLAGVFCVVFAKKLSAKDPSNALWTYLFWVSLAIAVFTVSRSFGHLLKYLLIFSGHRSLWKELSPVSGAVNSITFVIVGTLIFYYGRVRDSYRALRQERDRIQAEEMRLEDAHVAITHLIDEVRSGGDLSVRYENADLIDCWELKDCVHESCPAYLTNHLRCWHIGGNYCCNINKQGKDCGCEGCEIYRTAHKDPIQRLGESFNDMMYILEKQAGELQKVNEKLREEDLRKTKFLEIVAHDLRTPLTSILSYADLLLRYKDEPEETRDEFLQTIVHESERLSDLITDYLDLSRIESGKMEYHFFPIDLRKIIDHSVSVYSGTCLQKNIEISMERVPAQISLRGDKKRLIQVVCNLLSNAVKCIPSGGKIEIAAVHSESPPEWTVSISDTGPGIPPEHLEDIFEKYAQLHEGKSYEVNGSGLGLSICKEIIEAHAGRIQAENRPGGGAVFHIILPVLPRESAAVSYLQEQQRE